MTDKEIKQLENLITVPSPSGFEGYIADYIKDQVLEVLKEGNVEVDFQKNVIVKIDGVDTSKTIMIDAHLDQIGYVVTNISKEGLLSIGMLGGSDSSIISARHLNIITDGGIINAVVDRTHSHLVYDEDDENVGNLSDAQIDIGVRRFDEVSKYVKIGDPVVFHPHFYKLMEDFYAGYGFDDKAGCWVLLNTIKKFAKSKPPINIVFVFSSQEETGTRLPTIVNRFNPSAIISIDVTFGTDYGFGDVLDRQVGTCELGNGGVIYRGLGLDKEFYLALEKTAITKKLPFQTQANAISGGFTSLMVSSELNGIKASVIGVPLRNMHTPVEIICLKDLMNVSKLLTSFLKNPKISELI